MSVIALFARDAETREELRLAVEERGHSTLRAGELKDLVELVGRERPAAVLAAVEGKEDPEGILAELRRAAPLIPVVVALKPRSAVRAVELLRLGAFEVVGAPWTPENLAAALSKALRAQGTEFQVLPPPVVTRSPVLRFAAVLAVLLFAAGYLAYRTPPPPPAPEPTEWALPYNHPAGLAFRDKQLWVSDWFSQTVYRHDARTLEVAGTRHFPNEIPGAMAFAADSLWVASAPRSIVKHMLDDKLDVLGRFDDAAPQTVGMAYDGLYLWTCDAKDNRLHKRVFDSQLSIAASYRYPGARPVALAYDGHSLWSLDGGNRELLEHDIADPQRILRRVVLPEYRRGGWKPTGLAFDGKRFWTAAERLPKGDEPGRVFVHSVALEPR